ncbi:MAG: TlpA family protein disulfide reductase [Pseudomonadota bacterium]|nr:TlpA family protein disulfide reductase [Pseudomonadota bacterium]
MNSANPKRLIILLALAAAFGLGSTWWLHQPPVDSPLSASQARRSGIGSRLPAHPGEAVPGVDISAGVLMATSLPDANGKSHTLGEWSGHPLVINFWATWCDPCRAELPLLTAAAHKPEFKDVTVLGIALDDASAVREFMQGHALGFPVLVDANSIGQALAGRLGDGEGALPFTAIVDRRGQVVETRLGPWSAGELEQALARLGNS